MTPLENFYPTLAEIYASSNVPMDAIGQYKLNEFPLTADIKEKDGGFYLVVNNTGIETYLLPIDATKFESLDGAVQIEFILEGETCNGMNIDAYGYNLTSKKVLK